MRVMNLTPGWEPLGPGLSPRRSFTFPGGERHVDVGEASALDHVTITARLNSSDDVMTMLLAADAIKRGFAKVSLYAPYIPYARQDRVAIQGEPLSVAVMARLINSCGFERVYVLDPHSDVLTALIDNVIVLPTRDFVYDVRRTLRTMEVDNPVWLAPDAGAAKKAGALAKAEGMPLAVAMKHRDAETGQLTLGGIIGDVNRRDVVIFDDICDGGGTFVALARELYANNALNVFLAVSHGIFSKALEPMYHAGIRAIFTTDSIHSFGELAPFEQRGSKMPTLFVYDVTRTGVML